MGTLTGWGSLVENGPRPVHLQVNNSNCLHALLMLYHNLRCWPNIEPTSGRRHVLVGRNHLGMFTASHVYVHILCKKRN